MGDQALRIQPLRLLISEINNGPLYDCIFEQLTCRESGLAVIASILYVMTAVDCLRVVNDCFGLFLPSSNNI